jgi:hypothetical protein
MCVCEIRKVMVRPNGLPTLLPRACWVVYIQLMRRLNMEGVYTYVVDQPALLLFCARAAR